MVNHAIRRPVISVNDSTALTKITSGFKSLRIPI
ncbi:MAG: hypothetical protein ACI9U1_001567 [Porticoccaceae bacterium]|jgi:hypothetical protein